LCTQIDKMVSASSMEFYLSLMAKEKGETFDEERLVKPRQMIQKFLEVADRNLKGKEYLVGNYSLADIAFAPWVNRFEKYGVAIPENLSNVQAWMKRLATRHNIVSTRE